MISTTTIELVKYTGISGVIVIAILNIAITILKKGKIGKGQISIFCICGIFFLAIVSLNFINAPKNGSSDTFVISPHPSTNNPSTGNPTSTPTEIQNRILIPENNTLCSFNGAQQISTTVTGYASQKDNYQLWLVVNPESSIGFWPQSTISPDSNNCFSSSVTLAGDAKKFNILVVTADSDADKAFNLYLENGKKENAYPETPLPDGTNTLCQTTVIRK